MIFVFYRIIIQKGVETTIVKEIIRIGIMYTLLIEIEL